MPNGKRPRPLAGAEADAYAFADLLQLKYGFPKPNVHVLTAKDASHQAIADKFLSWQKKLAPDDQFVFYFAGHGTQVSDDLRYPPPFDEADALDEALCPHDAAVVDGKAASLIIDDQLANWLDGIPATRIAVVLDCCHAGTGVKGTQGEDIRERSLIPPHNERGRPIKQDQPWQELLTSHKGVRKRITALYASGPNQPAVERLFRDLPEPGQMRGQFSKLLIDYLNAQGTDASLSQISAHLQKEIACWVKQKETGQPAGGELLELLRRAGQQRPSFEPTDQGDRPLIFKLAQ
jgi:hypothetical protein